MSSTASTRRRPLGLAVILMVVMTVLAGVTAPVHAQDPADKINIRDLSRRLDEIDRALQYRNFRQEQLKEWNEDSQTVKQQAAGCVTTTEEALTKAKSDLQTLGPPIKGEAGDVSRQRYVLQQNISANEKRLASCKLLALRSDDTLSRIAAAQQQMLTERLLAQGPTIVDLVRDYMAHADVWYSRGKAAFLDNSGIRVLSTEHVAWLALMAGLVLAVGVLLRRRTCGRMRRRVADEAAAPKTFSGNLGVGLALVWASYLPYLLVTACIAVFFYAVTHGLKQVPLISIVAYGLPVYFLLIAAVRLVVDPPAPAVPLHQMPREVARSLGRRLRVLVLLVFVGYLLFSTLLTRGLPETALSLVRGVFGAVFILNLIWIAWIMGRIPRFAGTVGLRALLILALIASVAAEWMGYRNLSLYLLRALLGSLVTLGVVLLAARLLRELFDSLDSTQHQWQRRLHARLGLKPGERMRSIPWLRLVGSLLLWIGFVLVILRIWGLSDAGQQQLMTFVQNGWPSTAGSAIASNVVGCPRPAWTAVPARPW
jgi:potassium efflux system protein